MVYLSGAVPVSEEKVNANCHAGNDDVEHQLQWTTYKKNKLTKYDYQLKGLKSITNWTNI